MCLRSKKVGKIVVWMQLDRSLPGRRMGRSLRCFVKLASRASRSSRSIQTLCVGSSKRPTFCNAKRFHTQLHVESVSRCEAGEDHLLQSCGKRLLFLDVDGVLHPLKAGSNSSIGSTRKVSVWISHAIDSIDFWPLGLVPVALGKVRLMGQKVDTTHCFEPSCMEELCRVTKQSGADLVVTSSWRQHLGFLNLIVNYYQLTVIPLYRLYLLRLFNAFHKYSF